MLAGYVTVFTADEHQSTDMQQGALSMTGIDDRHVHEDRVQRRCAVGCSNTSRGKSL